MTDTDIEGLSGALMRGDRVALGKAITLVESGREDHRHLAGQLLEKCAPHVVKSQRIGITGVPGVGKSTFIEAVGVRLADAGGKVAVLAVDPSSGEGRGSILGDRTRMETLSARSDVFIRPSPTGGSLGGVARRTKETILLCEAAGYGTILIETVGVGQSETAVSELTDMFILLVLASAGDELQGIKRGIMEKADLIVINKDDGHNAALTAQAKATYHHAMHLFPAKANGWTVPVESCSSTEGKGLDAILSTIGRFFLHMTTSGHLDALRKSQDLRWMDRAVEEELLRWAMQRGDVRDRLGELRKAVESGQLSPFDAAHRLVQGL
jgi:LAO/AO transport system kinase